jgi:hypothetical protein
VFAVENADPVQLRELLRNIVQETGAIDPALVLSEIEEERGKEVVADVEECAPPVPKERWQYPRRKQGILYRKAQYIDRQPF